MEYPLPARLHTSSGAVRRIGVEIELGGLDVDEVARLVREHVGGAVATDGPGSAVVTGDPAGAWHVEVDSRFVRAGARPAEAAEARSTLEVVQDAVLDVVRHGVEQLVPTEVSTPPLPMPRLPEVEALVERLRSAGAVGTTASVLYAFGLQLNPELPSRDAETLRVYLQAFLCLHDWLKRRAQVDFTRRIAVFVDPFPLAYVRRVVDPAYAPDVEQLLADYLADNATRNRALDLLPALADLDPERVRAAVGDMKVKARPALHYRLPNSEIDRPGWRIEEAWRDWLVVEELAADRAALRELCRHYGQRLEQGIAPHDWADETEAWLAERAAR